MPSNQGSVMIDSLFDDCNPADIESASEVMWKEIHNHLPGASCFCPAVEVLCSLYERGYRLIKE